ncbi:MAG: lysophospholipid acyltransferase family protein [Akkermansiaceae bacterium]|nr:lysophospholipid acyltransferase family protein [Akkermansiaceae bacterium]
MAWTIRFRVEDRCGFTKQGGIGRPLIWCIWHNRMLALAMARVRVYPSRKGVVLTSASHDGAALASAVKVIGVGAVRGSTSRRGAAALKQMMRCLNDGLDVGVTPDGPRGPRYELNAGLLKLAQATGAPLMCFHARFEHALRLRTWDRFVIPLPFSKVHIVFDELLDVPRGLDDDSFEARRRDVEERMRAGVDDLDLPAHDHSRRKKNRRGGARRV